MIASIVIMA